MLQEKSFDNLKSETLHFPNVSNLMKISLGLILFTMISTVLVYAETTDDAVVQISQNGYLEGNSQYLDNTLFGSPAKDGFCCRPNSAAISETFSSK